MGNRRQFIRNFASGQTFIQVLVSLGLLSILTLSILTGQAFESAETIALAEKLAALDLKRTLTAALADGKVCSFVLNDLSLNPGGRRTFNINLVTATNPQVIPLATTTPLYASIDNGTPGPIVTQATLPASVLSSTLTVSSIQLSIGTCATSTCLGSWVVAFGNSSSALNVKPISISTRLTVDPTNPAKTTIVSCQGGGTSASCPTSMTLIGDANKPASYCIDTLPRAKSDYLSAESDCINSSYSGGRAHLCTYNEWLSACSLSSALLPDMLATPEWAVSLDSDSSACLNGGSGSCTNWGSAPFATLVPYRCCLRPN